MVRLRISQSEAVNASANQLTNLLLISRTPPIPQGEASNLILTWSPMPKKACNEKHLVIDPHCSNMNARTQEVTISSCFVQAQPFGAREGSEVSSMDLMTPYTPATNGRITSMTEEMLQSFPAYVRRVFSLTTLLERMV